MGSFSRSISLHGRRATMTERAFSASRRLTSASSCFMFFGSITSTLSAPHAVQMFSSESCFVASSRMVLPVAGWFWPPVMAVVELSRMIMSPFILLYTALMSPVMPEWTKVESPSTPTTLRPGMTRLNPSCSVIA